MDWTLFTVIITVITALGFDFTNGFHDSANAMATSVATGALKPRVAVLIAAVLNVAGAFISTEVAKTISGGIVNDELVTPLIVFCGLVGAILWNLITWLFGMPSSSSHALFGGLIGSVLIGAGINGVNFSVIISKIVLPAIVAPVVAGCAAALATYLAYRFVRDPEHGTAVKGFRTGQTVSASMVALAHGTSDGQKTMGVITLVLITAGYQESGTGPQFWVIATAGLAIGLGTYSGGWRIMRTMGRGLVDIKAPQGFAAETSLGRRDPRVVAPGLRPVHHAGLCRFGDRHRVRQEARRGPLDHCTPDGGRLAADPARRRRGRRDRRRGRQHRHVRRHRRRRGARHRRLHDLGDLAAERRLGGQRQRQLRGQPDPRAGRGGLSTGAGGERQ